MITPASSSSRSRQRVPYARCVPAPAAWGGNASGVEGVGNGAKGGCAGFADFGDDRQYVARRAISFRFHRRDRYALRGFNIWIAEFDALRLRRRERRLCAPGDQGALLFGERGIEMQNEGIDVRPEFRNEERDAMRHQAGNEMHVARETVELGDRDRATQRARLGERRRQLGPTIERVASLARLDFNKLGGDFKPLVAREPFNASRCASMPKPDRLCWLVLTLMYATIGFMGIFEVCIRLIR
jgi:hypothetical protein